jgi:transcriptional regulator with XRE-family HTH domain
MSQAEFATIIGMSRSAYGQVETGAINIGLEALVAACNHFGVTLDAIIFGNDQKTVTSNNLTSVAVTVDTIGRERIVFIDSKARASYPAYRLENSYFKPLHSFSLPGEEYQQSSYRCFEIEGDSMEKTLFNGDWVVSRYVDLSSQSLRDGYVYVIVTSEDIVIKRIELEADSIVTLISDNSFYKPVKIAFNTIREAWICTKKISGNFTPIKSDNAGLIEILGDELLNLKQRIINLENQ